MALRASMLTRRVLTPAFARPASLARSSPAALARGGGHDHHGPVTYEPYYHRLPLPTRPLHEEDELVWNDGVAPETALDFDVPFMSPLQGLVWWLGGFAFFALVYQYAKATNHPANKPSGERDFPEEVKQTALGGYGKF